jgi:hypothetical protein
MRRNGKSRPKQIPSADSDSRSQALAAIAKSWWIRAGGKAVQPGKSELRGPGAAAVGRGTGVDRGCSGG